jgi:hypothetical protein
VTDLCARTSRGERKSDAAFAVVPRRSGVVIAITGRREAPRAVHRSGGKESEGVLAGDDPRATIGAPTPFKSD